MLIERDDSNMSMNYKNEKRIEREKGISDSWYYLGGDDVASGEDISDGFR